MTTLKASRQGLATAGALNATGLRGLHEKNAERTPNECDGVVTPDAALLADADLSILAEAPETYDGYVGAVRREYGWATDDQWRAGRTAVLESLLAQPRLFKTDLLPGAEERARANVEREVAALTR